MHKSFTTFDRLTANTFNEHTAHDTGVISMGEYHIVGATVMIPGYKVQYNGIIVTDTDMTVVSFIDGDRYICVTNIDSATNSVPIVTALQEIAGVVLFERTEDKDWKSAIAHKAHLYRMVDGNDLFLIRGEETIQIDSIGRIPFERDISESPIVETTTVIGPIAAVATCELFTICQL